MNFYAYLHARPNTVDASGIFYVGKGHGERAYRFTQRNPYHMAVIEKHGAENVLISKLACSNEQLALELEKGLIKCLRRSGVRLANMTDGGDGVSGYQHTDQWRVHHSTIMKGKPSPAKGKVKSEAQRQKIAATLRITSPWIGRKHTKADRAKMGKAVNTVWVTNGVCRERAKAHEVSWYLALGFVKGMKL